MFDFSLLVPELIIFIYSVESKNYFLFFKSLLLHVSPISDSLNSLTDYPDSPDYLTIGIL